jgi:hypothetical protein
MRKVVVRTICITWEPESRLAVLGFLAKTYATGEDAQRLVKAMTEWIGPSGAPFGLLGDGKLLAGLDADYRATWGQFLRLHRDAVRIAFFNMGPLVRVAADMFRVGTGLRVKAFSHEHDARSWLCKQGIAA